MAKIAIIIGSTRPNRIGPTIAEWFVEKTKDSDNTEFELVDLVDYKLPILDEPHPGAETHEHTQKWSKKIAQFDGYIFVTPEYNHAIAGSFKNAIDFLNKEWQYKPVGYVSYGVIGGHRAVEQLRQVAAQFHQYDLRTQVSIAAPWDFIGSDGKFDANEHHNKDAQGLIEEMGFWAEEFKASRKKLEAI